MAGRRPEPWEQRRVEAVVAGWADDLREERAITARRRARWRSRRAVEESSLAELVAGLPQACPVVVHLAGGRRERGALAELGRDFLAVDAGGWRRHVAWSAVAGVQVGSPPAGAGRAGALAAEDRSLAGVMARVAGTGVDVRLVSRGVELHGEVKAVGEDFVEVACADPGGVVVYVPLGGVEEVSLRASG